MAALKGSATRTNAVRVLAATIVAPIVLALANPVNAQERSCTSGNGGECSISYNCQRLDYGGCQHLLENDADLFNVVYRCPSVMYWDLSLFLGHQATQSERQELYGALQPIVRQELTRRGYSDGFFITTTNSQVLRELVARIEDDTDWYDADALRNEMLWCGDQMMSYAQ